MSTAAVTDPTDPRPPAMVQHGESGVGRWLVVDLDAVAVAERIAAQVRANMIEALKKALPPDLGARIAAVLDNLVADAMDEGFEIDYGTSSSEQIERHRAAESAYVTERVTQTGLCGAQIAEVLEEALDGMTWDRDRAIEGIAGLRDGARRLMPAEYAEPSEAADTTTASEATEQQSR